MAKKIVKKRKIKLLNLLIILLIFFIVVLSIYYVLNIKIQNIIIKGTTYLKDDYIIEKAKLKDYPSFCFTTSYEIKKNIRKSPYVKDVEVKKKFFGRVVIKVKENKPLFFNETNKTLVLENKKEVKDYSKISNFRVPRLMNYVPDTKYEMLIRNSAKINSDILGKVSELTYVPNDYDKDRFLLYMDDDNSVYLTLTKFKMLNYYNKVLTQLGGQRGILYLDSGNHFQVKE